MNYSLLVASPRLSLKPPSLASWKKTKDLLACSSYCPISLLNADFKSLALRLEPVLPSTISVDQTGFIWNRPAFSNLRLLFSGVYNISCFSSPKGFKILGRWEGVSENTEQLLFLFFFALEKFDLGEKYFLLISFLQASVRTNNIPFDYRTGLPLESFAVFDRQQFPFNSVSIQSLYYRQSQK